MDRAEKTVAIETMAEQFRKTPNVYVTDFRGLTANQVADLRRKVRVAGPFTVESLSPHRVLSTDDEQPASGGNGHRETADFATMIIDNLRKAGVQNTRKDERLKFERLDPFAGTWIHATGEYVDADGKTKRAASRLPTTIIRIRPPRRSRCT